MYVCMYVSPSSSWGIDALRRRDDERHSESVDVAVGLFGRQVKSEIGTRFIFSYCNLLFDFFSFVWSARRLSKYFSYSSHSRAKECRT